MPRTTAMDTTRACDIRPILLNVMCFLNPRRRPPKRSRLCCEQIFGDASAPIIVEAAATLRHFAACILDRRKTARLVLFSWDAPDDASLAAACGPLQTPQRAPNRAEP